MIPDDIEAFGKLIAEFTDNMVEQNNQPLSEVQFVLPSDIEANDIKPLLEDQARLRSSLEIHQSDLDLMRQLSNLVDAAKVAMNRRKLRLDQAKTRVENCILQAQRKQAESDFSKSLDPDLNNPELIALIDILKTWENYERMDDYQIEDVIFYLDRWLRTKDQPDAATNTFTRGVINANDTGMGKTLETIAFLWVMRQLNPKASIIWFTKTSLVKETSPESSMKWGFNMIPVFGTSDDKVNMLKVMLSVPDMPACFAINYEAVNNDAVLDVLNSVSWDFMVIDEVHKLRGGANYRPTKMWTNTKKFKTQHNPWPIMLSGSIINNQPKEIWSYLHIMDPLRFPDVWEFETTMRAAFSVKEAQAQLMKVLAPSMRRRRKDEVAIKMPERVFQHHIIELDPKGTLSRIYEDFSEQMYAELDNLEKEKVQINAKTVLDKLIRLRALLVAPGHIKVNTKKIDPRTLNVVESTETLDTGEPEKLNEVIELIDDLTMEGQQVVVASSGFKAPLDYIAAKINPLVKAEKLYGKNTSIGGDIASRFRSGETQVILTNLQSGAEGFNLHKSADWPGGAEHLILIDDWYNGELVRQMCDRVWRRGAINRVIIHQFQVDNSVDQFVEAIRLSKTKANSMITESTVLRAGEWKELLGQYLKRPTKK
jgi:SNF2 family DNA or RNA helicase